MARPLSLEDWPCARCGRMLGRLYLTAGSIVEVKCDKCGALNILQIQKAKRRQPEGEAEKTLVPLRGI